jgi:hypothetical protein
MAALAHFGFGFAAKRIAPKVPVGFLLVACGILDFAAMGIQYLVTGAGMAPVIWTHSLLMAAAWALVTAGVAALISRNTRAALVMGGLVFMHWIMDLITWPMTAASVQAGSGVPLLFSEVPNVGLGLYRSIFGVILGEGVMFLAGVAVYVLTLIRIKKEKRTAAQARA